KVARESFVGGGARRRMGRFIAVDLGLGRYEVAADPRPDRSEDRARDAAWALVCRIVIDEERLQRCEEGPRRIPGSGRRLSRSARRSAPLLRQLGTAWELVATSRGPLELNGEQRQRPGGQLPKVASQSLRQPRHRAPARIDPALNLP